MKHTLTVTWPRGNKHVSPACDHNRVSKDNIECYYPCAICEFNTAREYYDGTAPTAHPAFNDAVLMPYGVWMQTCRNLPSVKAATELGKAKVAHLRSWGIIADFQVS